MKPISQTRLKLSLLLLLLVFRSPSAEPVKTIQDDSLLNLQLSSQPVLRPRQADPLSERTREFLLSRDSSFARVWLFFTDKNIADQSDFDRKAKLIRFSDKVQRRRAKSGIEKIRFVDLPVEKEYVRQVQTLGGKLRRVSKYLNGASFDIAWEFMSGVGELEFVASIRPVGAFKRTVPVNVLPSPDDPNIPLQPPGVPDYGLSSSQLYQISVPKVHAKGFDGSGVTIAIFDTGFRKTHDALAVHFAEGRVLAEYDFVFNDDNTANDTNDLANQWNHGTSTWSVAGAYKPGTLVGPAFNANFLLAKTEDLRSETPLEEDNWMAAVEWSDSLGADIISSSVGYFYWYDYSDFDGSTAIVTIAANIAASSGILVCNSMGNSGPSSGSLIAPADAFGILAVGAVSSSGGVASFSSRGPTFDGRIKPEVCALGINDKAATAESDQSYGTMSGTSFSAPLVAGAAALLIQAHPTFPVQLIRTSLMQTASQSDSPDNNLGWGIINTFDALNWGVNFYADTTFGTIPLTIQFTDSSALSAESWQWDFGDGSGSDIQNPAHTFGQPGGYDISLTASTLYGDISIDKSVYIIAIADTLKFVSDSAYAGRSLVMSVHLTNSMPLSRITLPFVFDGTPSLVLDSAGRGERTEYFETLRVLTSSPQDNRYTYKLQADSGGGAEPLPPGRGEILRLYFTIDELAIGGQSNVVDSTKNFTHRLSLGADFGSYPPTVHSGTIGIKYILRGDADNSGSFDIVDIMHTVRYLYFYGERSFTIQSADANFDLSITFTDIVYMVDYFFKGGAAPPSP